MPAHPLHQTKRHIAKRVYPPKPERVYLYGTCLADTQLRENFRGAMDYLMDKRQQAFPSEDELETLRRKCQLIKQRCLLKLPDLLEQLESNLEANGIRVHWAETPAEANAIIAELIEHKNGRQVVKGKSMVSEETALNDHLQARGIECLETDMGEFIVQMADQHPSHIIVPAIRQNKGQVADLFAQLKKAAADHRASGISR